jgi:hypothetical protein
VQGVFRNDGDAVINGHLEVDTIAAGNLGPLALTRSAGLVLVQTTDNEATNGQNLLNAYTTARGLTPHGMARSGSNRVAILIPPARYNLGTSQLWLSDEYIDVVGLSPVRENQYVFGSSSGSNSGVLRQSANDVRIENLFVECTKSTGSLFGLDPSDPAAYYPNSGLARTVVRNCRFSATHDWVYGLTMRTHTSYAGTYEDVVAGRSSFGFGSTASGTFIRCTGGQDSFGSAGTASGTFIDCLGTGWSFGGTRSGSGQATGTFRNCTYQNDDGTAFFPTHSWGGALSGRMESCKWRANLTLANGAVLYDSTILGTISGSGAFGSCKVVHTRARGLSLSPLTNDIDAPNNVVDTDME